MRIADLKRAVEDVILRPDDNRISDISKRSTIAALDLCQLERVSETSGMGMGTDMQQHGSAATLTSFSCSGEMLSGCAFDERSESTCSTSVTTSDTPSVNKPPLSMSTSLDTMVHRHSISCRPSLAPSRRSSRILQHLSHSKRKRSNSVSSCLNKGNASDQQMISVGDMNNPLLDNECIQSSAVSSLPPTARHTPFRYSVEFDDNQHFINTNLIANPSDVTTVAIPSSSSAASFQAHYSLAVIPPAPSDTQEMHLLSTMLDSVGEHDNNTDWSAAPIPNDSRETQQNPFDERNSEIVNNSQTSSTFLSGNENVSLEQRSSSEFVQPERPHNPALSASPFSFTTFRQPVNICDLDEQMDCD